MVTGWREIGGKWYFFGDDGVMATSTWVWDYYVDEDGVWGALLLRQYYFR